MIYAGFDRAECPPMSMMSRLLAETNLVWCGYYLKAPSQSGAGWTGKRAQLVAMGWACVPIFVGQQTQGPGAKVVTREQGWIDASRALTALKSEGFPAGTYCFLDLENGKPFTAGEHDYVAAWIDGVEAGGYRGAVYCSYSFAAEVAALRPKARIWTFKVTTTARHAIAGKVFEAPDPKKASPVASVWQHEMNASLPAFGLEPVDLDSSIMRDPGAPDAPAVAQASPARPPAPPIVPVTPPAPLAPPDAPAPIPAPAGWWQRLVASIGAFFSRAA